MYFEWQFKYGERLNDLLEIQEQLGHTPDGLRNIPEIPKYLRYYHKIWQELSGSRNYTMGGPAEIPFSEIFLWCIAQGFTKEDIGDLWEELHRIDMIWLSEYSKNRKLQEDSKKKTSA